MCQLNSQPEAAAWAVARAQVACLLSQGAFRQQKDFLSSSKAKGVLSTEGAAAHSRRHEATGHYEDEARQQGRKPHGFSCSPAWRQARVIPGELLLFFFLPSDAVGSMAPTELWTPGGALPWRSLGLTY